ncbi:Recombination protein RecR [Sedimentisphaera cyanobacteriorum]|uniref:Recombination protein RecR n=1 Tax=Sedimentisphaera cyanobacteriorum TaxID=1940790 RepID=A0A1Q2HSN9_9BACT|nr:recombination mediator RecR [Sedimentisphaera cyanobacteriorum]AQQ10462.1 Recombination protein RecR [Sedimentisphaera cyanobacteriorum]
MPEKNTTNPAYTKALNNLIEKFAELPGIGRKTAERLAFHVLKSEKAEAMELARAVSEVKTKIKQCKICCSYSEEEICPICQAPSRDKSTVCVVEQPKDLISLEKTGICKWTYHVLGGHIAPLEGIEPEDLTIDKLISRIRQGGIREIIMATNPTVEGDATSLYVTSLLRDSSIRITRLARGLPAGSSIEFSNNSILSDAILGRDEIE